MVLEVTNVAERINEKVLLLENRRADLKPAAAKMAATKADHKRALATVLIKLKNGQTFTLEGQDIKDPPATITKSIAEGICWAEQLRMDAAKTEYEIVKDKLDIVCAELNGLQSIYRHLDET